MLLGRLDVNSSELSEQEYSYSSPIINSHFSVKDIQLGRRNLTPIQKISIAEKYRPIYEKQAKENQLSGLKQNRNNTVSAKLPKRQTNPINTAEKLASIANVSEKTYRMGAKILNSDNEKLKQEVLSGKKSINAGPNLWRKKAPTFNENMPQMQENQGFQEQFSTFGM